MSVLSPEVAFHIQQRIDYYCNLYHFVSSKLLLCRKALVNISTKLHLIQFQFLTILHVFASLVGIQIDILQIQSSNLLYLKLLTSSESVFYFSILALNLYHIRSTYKDFRYRFYLALSQWPAMGGFYITTD